MKNKLNERMVSAVLAGLMNVHDSIWTIKEHKEWCFNEYPELKRVVEFNGVKENLVYVIRTLSDRGYSYSGIVRYIDEHYSV